MTVVHPTEPARSPRSVRVLVARILGLAAAILAVPALVGAAAASGVAARTGHCPAPSRRADAWCSASQLTHDLAAQAALVTAVAAAVLVAVALAGMLAGATRSPGPDPAP